TGPYGRCSPGSRCAQGTTRRPGERPDHAGLSTRAEDGSRGTGPRKEAQAPSRPNSGSCATGPGTGAGGTAPEPATAPRRTGPNPEPPAPTQAPTGARE